MQSQVEPGMIKELNQDLWTRIFGHLYSWEILGIMLVSTQWRDLGYVMTDTDLYAEIKPVKSLLLIYNIKKDPQQKAEIIKETNESRKERAESLEAYILQRRATLKTIVIRSRALSYEFFIRVWTAAMQCKQLKTLEISMPFYPTPGDPEKVGDFPYLEFNCPLPKNLEVLLISVPFLRSGPKSSLRGLVTQLQQADKLKVLGIPIKLYADEYRKPKVTGMKEIQKHLQSLTLYSGERTGIETKQFHTVSQFRSLKALAVNGAFEICERFLAVFMELRGLEYLAFTETMGLEGNFSVLAEHPALRSIKLSASDASQEAITTALPLQHLHEFQLEQVHEVFGRVTFPRLHPKSELRVLRVDVWCEAVFDFWDLVSGPAMKDLRIKCLDLTTNIAEPTKRAKQAFKDRKIDVSIIAEGDFKEPEKRVLEDLLFDVDIYPAMGSGAIDNEKTDHGHACRQSSERPRDHRCDGNLPCWMKIEEVDGKAQDPQLSHAIQQQAWQAEFDYVSDDEWYMEGEDLVEVISKQFARTKRPHEWEE